MVSQPRIWVRSLIGELRSHKPRGVAKKIIFKIKNIILSGQEGLLEEGMATHSSILAWEILWTEEPGGL